MALHLRREGVRISPRRAGPLMRLRPGFRQSSGAAHQRSRIPSTWSTAPASGLAIERPNHVGAPIVLHPGAAWQPLRPRRSDWALPVRPGLAAVEHAGRELLHRHARRGPGSIRQAGDLQYRPRQPVHQLCLHRTPAGGRHPDLDGWQGPVHGQHLHRAAVAARSNTRRVYLHEIADGFQARRLIGDWVPLCTDVERPHIARSTGPRHPYGRSAPYMLPPWAPPPAGGYATSIASPQRRAPRARCRRWRSSRQREEQHVSSVAILAA